MARVLIQLREYRRAIPFCERAILRELESNDPTAVAGMLARAAQCYGLMGLMDHSAIPARAALKILRDYPGDPRLPDVLITLGNALRKTSPPEAESLYREAAGLHEGKEHLESATTAWNNLGTLCAEQGRFAEALEYYEKALEVRERTPSTPLARIGSLLNNIANCHRRMGNYAKAHELLDRAIQLLKLESQTGVSGLASAYGTRGLVLRDEGRDKEALEFFELSDTERKNTPSPNLESTKENLEEEIAVLKKLGRREEGVAAEGRLAEAIAAKSGIPTVDRELGSHISQAKGSVLVEIDFGKPDRQTATAARIWQRLALGAFGCCEDSKHRFLRRQRHDSRKHNADVLRRRCGSAVPGHGTGAGQGAHLRRSIGNDPGRQASAGGSSAGEKPCKRSARKRGCGPKQTRGP